MAGGAGRLVRAGAAPGDPPAPLRAPAPVHFPAAGGDASEEIDAALAALPEDASPRHAVTALLRARLAAGREEIAGRLRDAPRRAPEVTAAYAELADTAVRGAFHAARRRHPPEGPADRLAVVGVGGYGRGEMAPHSDVDLLFLTPKAITPWATRVIEEALYVLWDLKLKVGHASRTVADCLALARSDATIRTSLMEQRVLGGDGALAATLQSRLRSEVFRGTEREFVAVKLAERDARLKKNGGQRYVTEPNVKEGKGGLRDLQSLYWIAKYVYDVRDEGDLVAKGLFSRAEFETFERARGFLWAVRCHMHLAAGRAVEQLTFDLQAEVAGRMGYADRGGRRAVEHFMQAYFRQASAVGELTRILLTKLEADHIKPEPMLQGLLRRRRKVRAGFKVRQNRLDIERPDLFEEDPLDILRLFEEALRSGLLIHPDAMRAVQSRLHLIDAAFRERPEARRIFLDTILKHGNPERALRRMSELGVLAAFIPEFEPITAMMQFNMYHKYTVDEHTIQCIAELARIEKGELAAELPLATGIVAGGVNRKVLTVALLLHDIGKGREEDHSILGRSHRPPRRPPARPHEGGGRVGGMARAPPPADERHRAEARSVRPADDPRLRQGGGIARAARPADGADGLRHPRGGAGDLEQLEGDVADPPTPRRRPPPRSRTGWRFASTASMRRARRPRRSRAALSGLEPRQGCCAAETARHYAPYWQNLPTEPRMSPSPGLLRRHLTDGEMRI